MFYSHTFLARKGPLGTVWCAAHLQHRLKKSHYASTNIPSTVERIMYPEVPIALRMSGHLLLGVVRIYSKQVDYLYQDCNVILIGITKAFSSVNVNLPEDATHAPFHSVTLPEKFELDVLELEDDLMQDRMEDNHLKSHEEITLTDQIPIGRDPYIAFTIDEDTLRDSLLPSEDDPGSGVRPMEEDSQHSVPENAAPGHSDAPSSDHAGLDKGNAEDSNPQNYPEIETMRDAGRDYHVENPLLDDVMEPDMVLEKQILEDREALTPAKETLASGGLPFQSPAQQEMPSATSEQSQENFDVHISFGHASPELVVRSTPPVEQPQVQQPQPRRRKRKQHFDRSLVLRNNFIRRRLQDGSGLCRVRKYGPCSTLGVWRSSCRLKKDAVFHEPLYTGLSADLSNLYERDHILSKPHLVSSEGAHPGPTLELFSEDARPGPTLETSPVHDTDQEIERLRDFEGPGSNLLPEIFTSTNENIPSPSTCMPSVTARDDFTPATTNFGSDSGQPTSGTGVLPTPDLAASTGSHNSDMESPATSFGVERTALSDIPELVNSAGELSFLEQDDNSPAGSLRTPESGYASRKERGTPEFDTLSARTRAVAQYLKRQSLRTPISGESHGDLSLNTILEGKSRKISARMFSETLVLRNYGYVDVHQDEPYGDITLRVNTTKLSKEQCLS